MKKILLATLIAAATSTSFAAITVPGGTVTINGDITAGACAVSSDDANKIVELDTVPTHKFTAANEVANTKKQFNITLVDCDTSAADTVSVTFTGMGVDGTPGILANTAGAGSAQNIAIQLYDETGVALELGTASRDYTVAQTTPMTFAADYISTAAAVTAGKVSASANFELAYQ